MSTNNAPQLKTFHLRRFFIYVNMAIALCIVGAAGYFYYLREELHAINVQTTESNDANVELGEAKLHIVQIQQFLTDAAATHDEAGFKDAEEHYSAFKKNARGNRKP